MHQGRGDLTTVDLNDPITVIQNGKMPRTGKRFNDFTLG
jgi:hypothetical protein